MKVAISLCAILALFSSSESFAKADEAYITGECLNPPHSLGLASHVTVNKAGHAEFFPIQIDVNRPPSFGDGSLFLNANPRDDVECRVRISKDYKLEHVSFRFQAGGTWNASHQGVPDYIEREILNSEHTKEIRIDDQEIEFVFGLTNFAGEAQQGNATVVILVEYKPVELKQKE